MSKASSDIAIRVNGVSKSFPMLTSPAKQMAHYLLPVAAGKGKNEFVALEGISFDVPRGTTFGVMGRNGSGKSTLLQVLAGILTPNAGGVEVNGRIAALLELGSGFNPEFTGIENVQLNAAMLGLSKKEIEAKLPAIIDFAEIGEHVNLPVKTYSSGMMLRLAFAVQVAVNPDILIVDEALAVGDALFQLKCFRRIEQLKKNGTTILFVSHSTEQIRSLCDNALVLEAGKVVFLGDVKSATIKYLETIFPEEHMGTFGGSQHQPSIDHSEALDENGDIVVSDITRYATKTFGLGGASLAHLRIIGADAHGNLVGGSKITAIADFKWDREAVAKIVESDGVEPNITLGISLANTKGIYIFGLNGFDKDLRIDSRERDGTTLRFEFVMPSLAEGQYYLSVAIALGDLPKHVQLRWYDTFLPIHCAPDKPILGMLGVNTTIELVTGGTHV